MPHKSSVQIYKIDGVGINLERFYPARSAEEKISIRTQHGFSAGDFILIYTAEFIPRKNHKLLFSILPGLKAKIPALKLILCGTGGLLAHYRDFAAAHGMDFVTFTGYTREVADFCRLSDVLVMPSVQEGLPMAMVEAIAAGLPVVASDIRGHNDVIEDCANGFLSAPDDAAGFAKAILALYKNPALRAEFGKRNVIEAEKYGIERAVNSMAAIYKELVSPNGGGYRCRVVFARNDVEERYAA